MESIVERAQSLRRPGEVIRVFGVGAYLGLLLHPRRDLLTEVAERHLRHGIPMPGRAGDAYRLSALLEFRMARIYRRMAERFRDTPPAHALFAELQAEEEQHGRLMLLCLYTVRRSPALRYLPGVRDPQIRALLQELRQVQRNVERLTLDEALALTERLERSEVNTIFERLLGQVQRPQSTYFARQLEAAGDHRETVPPRVAELRARLCAAA